MKILKVAIIGSPLTDGNKTRGVGYYTKNLYENLIKLPNIKVDLVENCKSENYDLIHYPFFDPFSSTLKKHKKPTLVTVHDLIPIQYKKHFPIGIKGSLKWIGQLYRLRRCNGIITVSKYSQKIINKITSISKYKIHPIYIAADSNFKPISDKKTLDQIKNKYKLPNKFVLYVGDINWNKNVPHLIKTCQELCYPLVIVGSAAVQKETPVHPWTKDLIAVQKNDYPQKIGFVPDKDLPYIYNLATLYCQPSICEGFGLPLIQAMQSGCPLVYNSTSSMVELASGVGLKYTIGNIKKLWNNQKIRNVYSKKGLKHAQKFNWNTTAKKTLSLYKKYAK